MTHTGVKGAADCKSRLKFLLERGPMTLQMTLQDIAIIVIGAVGILGVMALVVIGNQLTRIADAAEDRNKDFDAE